MAGQRPGPFVGCGQEPASAARASAVFRLIPPDAAVDNHAVRPCLEMDFANAFAAAPATAVAAAGLLAVARRGIRLCLQARVAAAAAHPFLRSRLDQSQRNFDAE